MNITALRPDETIAILQADFVNCWIPIAQVTLAAPAASVTFASIPQNFRTLVSVTLARTDRNANSDVANWQANGDGGANYDYVAVYGNNSLAGSAAVVAQTSCQDSAIEGNTSRANCFGGGLTFWPNYRSATAEKESINVSGIESVPSAASMWVWLRVGHWRSTAAITSLTFLPNIGPNFVAGSIFQLYGIL